MKTAIILMSLFTVAINSHSALATDYPIPMGLRWDMPPSEVEEHLAGKLTLVESITPGGETQMMGDLVQYYTGEFDGFKNHGVEMEFLHRKLVSISVKFGNTQEYIPEIDRFIEIMTERYGKPMAGPIDNGGHISLWKLSHDTIASVHLQQTGHKEDYNGWSFAKTSFLSNSLKRKERKKQKQTPSTPVTEHDLTPNWNQASENREHNQQEFISDSCQALAKTFGPASRLSSVQKEELWKQYVGKQFKWKLRVTEVSPGLLGGYIIQYKCLQSQSFFQDIVLTYSSGAKNYVLGLTKGSVYTVTGILQTYSEILGLKAHAVNYQN